MMMKKMMSLLLVLVLCLGLTALPVLADADGFVIEDGVLTEYRGSAVDIVVPEGVTKIARAAFCGYATHRTGKPNIRRVTLPDSLTEIEDFAFSSCGELEYVYMPTGVTVTTNAFTGCGKLENVTNWPDPVFAATLEKNLSYRELWRPDFSAYYSLRYGPDDCSGGKYPEISAQTEEIVRGMTDQYEKAEAIARWIHQNIQYNYDYYRGYGASLSTDPREVLAAGMTVCEGFAALTAAMFNAAHIPCVTLSGRAYNNGSNNGGHAWNIAFVNGKTLWMDNTWGMGYFDCGTFFMSMRHSLNKWRGDNYGPSSWAAAEVEEALSEGLCVPMNLKESITRGKFCELMMLLLKKRLGIDPEDVLAGADRSVRSAFSDTLYPSDENRCILAAYVLGIVKGKGDGSFDVYGKITRQEAAAMLRRTAAVLGIETAGTAISFSDSAQIASWAREDVAFISGLTDRESGLRVMGGVGNDRFDPKGSYTVEQAFLTVLRLYHC